MTPRETAAVVRKTENSLAIDRDRDRGLPYHKVGRKIVYAKADVLAYLQARRVEPQNATFVARS